MAEDSQLDEDRPFSVPAIAHPEMFFNVTGIKIPDEAFELAPIGARIHVVKTPAPKRYGLIDIPSSSEESMGIGWILAAGALAGSEMDATSRYPFGPVTEDCSDLLYKCIIFSKDVGRPIRFDIRDSAYESRVYVMTTSDVWGFHLNPQRHGDDDGES